MVQKEEKIREAIVRECCSECPFGQTIEILDKSIMARCGGAVAAPAINMPQPPGHSPDPAVLQDPTLFKKCKTCLKEKPLSEFPRSNKTPDRLAYSCRACCKPRGKAAHKNAAPEKKPNKTNNSALDLEDLTYPHKCTIGNCKAKFKNIGQLIEHRNKDHR